MEKAVKSFIFFFLSLCSLSCTRDRFNWYSVGDSITSQNGKKYNVGIEKGLRAVGYQDYVISKIAATRNVRLKNCGYNSLPLTRKDDNETILAKLVNISFKKADLVTIAVGTNDFRQDIELGSIGDRDSFTFCGALEELIRGIKESNDKCSIILMTPIMRNKDGIGPQSVNKKGKKLIDYCNIIKNIGKCYGIQVIDLYSNSWITERNINEYTYDGLHPNNLGYSKIGIQMLTEIPPHVWTN